MIRFAKLAVLGGAAISAAACSNSDDASTEAMPETVEVAADEALASVVEEPIEDENAAGPPSAESDGTEGPAQEAAE
ncbi:MAG: hypothetical protein ABJN35_11630 [Erythrobacter sp.]